MISPPKNRSSASSPPQIIQSSDTEFQIQRETITIADVKLQDTYAGTKVEIARDVKLNGVRRITEYAMAVVSLLFLGTAVETFLPSTARLVESSFAAAGMSFLTLLKGI